jgi:trehalose 6-phosphate synthase/phosphatase
MGSPSKQPAPSAGEVDAEFKHMKLSTGESSRLLVAFYTLPELVADDTFEMSFAEREFNSTLSAVRGLETHKVISKHLWIGCSTKETNDLVDPPTLFGEEAKNCITVTGMSNQLFTDFVHGFCKGILWPLFHYHLKDVNYDLKLWHAYQQANRLFADAIIAVYQPGDLIWVHGYHLMLVPHMLREKIPDATIGWFLHAAFPSYEIFRVLPCRGELLEGILDSNLVGFQTYSTTSEFLQCCTRLLGYDATIKEVTTSSGHTTVVDVYPIGIDPKELLDVVHSEDVQRRISELKKSFAGKKIIIARDRMEKSNGILQKLDAIEHLLETHTSWHGNLVYLQICEPITSQAQQEQQSDLAASVFELVGRINGKFGRVGYVPVELYNQRIKKEEICALYRIADVALVAPLRAGMNTDVHEYVTCRGSGDEEDVGVVVVSEFAGSARCFCGALIVNPYSKSEVSSALHEALTMPEDEKIEKHKSNWHYVQTHTCYVWADAFLSDLVGSLKRLNISPVPKLDVNAVKTAYKEASKRLLLLDYDGTLTPIVKEPSAALPPQRTLNVLRKLASDDRNKVYVISGRDSNILEKWLGHLNIGLCCEHGSFIRDTKESNWVSTTNDAINGADWRDAVWTLMKYYEERTPGAVVEEKASSIAWHYRNADPQYSTNQATELMSHLKGVSAKYPVDVLWGNKVIEARPSGVNKGGAARRLIAEINPDFILCIGDDKTDEDMFAAVDKTLPTTFTVVVKRKASQAKAYVREQRDVVSLLEKLGEDVTSPQQPQ